MTMDIKTDVLISQSFMLKFGLGVFNQGSNTKFRVGATFEMRTVNDNARQGLYIKSNGVGREQDSRERERGGREAECH